MIDNFVCSACFELLFEPILLPCSQYCCKRCLRIPKQITTTTAKNSHLNAVESNCSTVGSNATLGRENQKEANLCPLTNTQNSLNSLKTITNDNNQNASTTNAQDTATILQNTCLTNTIGAYTCPSKACQKLHRYKNEQVLSSFNVILMKLFPQEQQSLLECKLGEEIMLKTKNYELVIKEYFTPIIEKSPYLQLPLLLRSKCFNELRMFDLARLDCKVANELNKLNKRGIICEKLINWCEQIHSKEDNKLEKEIGTSVQKRTWCEKIRQKSGNSCLITDLRDQLKLACNFSCPKDNLSKRMLQKSIRFENIVAKDFECQLCLDYYNEPIATPCGHVYCRNCLLQTLNHSRLCPLCRSILPQIGYFFKRPVLKVYDYFVKEYFKIIMKPTFIDIFEPCWMPIMQVPLIFPTSKQSLHISDEHYRVMIKRVLESTMKFGAMLPCSANDEIEYGTIVEITKFEPLLSCEIIRTCDGNLPRYVIEVQGLSRFKISSVRLTSGNYYEALCTRVEDQDFENTDWDPKHLELLITNCRQKISTLLQNLPSTAKLHMDRKYGTMPNEPEEFSFWLAEVLPLNQYLLYKILGMTRVEERLEQLLQWLEMAMVPNV